MSDAHTSLHLPVHVKKHKFSSNRHVILYTMFFKLMWGVVLTAERCFWQVNSGSRLTVGWRSSFMREVTKARVTAAGTRVIILFILHLVKSGIALPHMRSRVYIPKIKTEKNLTLPACTALFSTCWMWLQGSLQGQTEQSRLEDDCVPSFLYDTTYVQYELRDNRNKTAH